jgi:hypothetical protein
VEIIAQTLCEIQLNNVIIYKNQKRYKINPDNLNIMVNTVTSVRACVYVFVCTTAVNCLIYYHVNNIINIHDTRQEVRLLIPGFISVLASTALTPRD